VAPGASKRGGTTSGTTFFVALQISFDFVARESQLERALSVAHIPLTVAWMPVRAFAP